MDAFIPRDALKTQNPWEDGFITKSLVGQTNGYLQTTKSKMDWYTQMDGYIQKGRIHPKWSDTPKYPKIL